VRRTKPRLAAAAVVGAVAILAAACGGGSSSPSSGGKLVGKSSSAPAGAPNLTFNGTLTVDAGEYTPAIAGIKVAPGSVADPAMQDAANAFEKMYPGIKIKFVPTTASIGTNQWYITESAAGQLPDISEVPGYYVNINLPTGIYQNLMPAFQKPNPFIPGNKSWVSTMNTYALKIDTVPGNTPGTTGVYVVNGDWGGIGFFYNKNLFKEAGISAPPTSWLQLIADSKQIDARLSSKGVYAGASFAPVIYNWFQHIFEANYLGQQRDILLNSVPAALNVGVLPYFYYHDGSFLNPSVNPELNAWWPAGKALIDTWDPKNYLVPENTSIPNTSSTMFLGQQVAYAFVSGYSLEAQVAALPKSQQFPIGYFEITDLKGTSKYATDLPTWQDNGGPAVGFQYGIASKKADSSMTPAKQQAATAWLQFISTPEWDSNIVNGESNAVPIIKGAHTTPALSPILKMINAATPTTYGVYFGDGLTSSSFDEIDGLYLQYADGYISLNDAIKKFDSDQTTVMNQYIAANKGAVAQTAAYLNAKLKQ
jgi:raffinose/stachyose/melibiose transport system substrate-binding protein